MAKLTTTYRNIAAHKLINLYQFFKHYCLLLLLIATAGNALGQLTISGTVYDSSRVIPVKGVTVKSTGGKFTATDSLGHYDIAATDNDSLTFVYLNKPTPKFAVKQIENIGSFDISLHVKVNEKFKMLKEVRVFSKSYKEDSIANREEYKKIFGYQRPGIQTTSSGYSGTPGLDLDEFINIFRFRRNKQLKHMQTRLLDQEQEHYVTYRFNKPLVKRITHLEGSNLDTFMVKYRPDFAFVQSSSTAVFYQYILNSSYQFRSELIGAPAKKEGP